MLPTYLYLSICEEYDAHRTFDNYEEATSFVRKKGVIETFKKSGDYYVFQKIERTGTDIGLKDVKNVKSKFGDELGSKRLHKFSARCFLNIDKNVLKKCKEDEWR